ncbi:hypothetical protein GC175_30855 [bacterium]|nr:hypothetical protein [bacterium]
MAYVSTLPADVTNKKPGDPIRSADWNALASEVVNLSENKLDRADNSLKGDLNVPGSLTVAGSAALHQGLKITGGPIDFGDYTGPLVGAWGAAYGMGMQSNNLYFRTGSTYAWFKHGKHSGGQQDAGEGGKVMMTLDNNGLILADGLKVGKPATFAQGLTVSGGGTTLSEGAISFGKRTGQHINLWGTEYGLGIQSNTLYFRTADKFAWHKNGKHSDDIADPGGGVNLMTLEADSGLTVSNGIKVLSTGQPRLLLQSRAPSASRIDFAQDTQIKWTLISDFDQSPKWSQFEIVRNNSLDQRLFILNSEGNVTIKGGLYQYSDARIKDDPVPVDPSQSLQRLLDLTVYEYSFRPEYKPDESGVKHRGFLAQEVKQIIPSAVTIARDYTLGDGQVIDNIHTVAHDLIFTEAVGAIQALHQRLQAQEARIQQLVVQLAAADATAAQA